MNKRFFLLIFIAICTNILVQAQVTKPILKTYKVAIFAPLYLDSIFDGNFYRYGKNSFPKFAQPGLDFVHGAQAALDSLPLPNGNIQAYIFDSKAKIETIPNLISNSKLDSIDLIIGSVKDAEFTQLATYAKQKNIPFVSATSPSDGGVTNNPFLAIANGTLRAHCEAIYAYLLQNHGTDVIYLCRKKGGQEDKIADYFKTINESNGAPLLTIQTVNFESDFSLLNKKLDSNRKTVIIGASLSEDFVSSLVKAMYDLYETYPIEVIGMPNWDGFDALRKKDLQDFPILYTTSFYSTKSDMLSKKLQACYKKKYKGTPTDMSYKGFETAYVFGRLITRYPDDFMSHLNEYAYKVFNEYNFKPVYINKKNNVPDYFENKRLYFMKILNGKIVKN